MRASARPGLFALVALAALVFGYILGQTRARDPFDIKPLMTASFPDLQGRSRSLAEWQGSVLVVNFWATWCPPCLREIPDFIRMQEKLRGKGVQFVGIAADQPDKVRLFAANYRINYPVLLGDMSVIEIAQRAGNQAGGLPFTVILDREGKWVSSVSGILDEQRLNTLVEPLLQNSSDRQPIK